MTTQMISRLHDVGPAGLGIDALIPGMLVRIGDSCALDYRSSEHPGDEPTHKFPISANDTRRHAERLESYIAVCLGLRHTAGL
jgi:hypothetical protein